ncbi:hypothetical protein SAMN05421831_1142 [Allopseudospirillum japonicum]|uniref:GTP-binding protein n=1 Tax=Allopseudospirillum japonicum TaxID=64971 RepID=A0A1H6UE99_9GAMM|nr:DUF465 domain-containing protein [Allopseudospirillum japonicum]SEI86485.1 hypothetical protein SAMN05421831_1142 [Allopseudospirillum japonicum]
MLENHNLVNEFPEYRDKIHDLKMADAHFARLFNEYHQVDREVHRIEVGAENPSDVYTEDLKKKRLLLKDQLYAILQDA